MAISPEQLGRPLVVAKRIQETADAVSLVLDIPPEHKLQFRFQSGQFVTFFLKFGTETLPRSYSISSSPLVDNDFKVTVKKVPGGRGSTYLCEDVKAGDTLLTTPPAGNFFKPALDSSGVHYVLYAAGSGITPIFSILKTVLTASPLNHVTLVFCNRNEESIIYKQEIETWGQAQSSRLTIHHTFSQPTADSKGRKGRADGPWIKQILESLGGPTHRSYFLCGPTPFMSAVTETLKSRHIDQSLIHQESFGLELHNPNAALQENWTLIGPDTLSPNESPEKIIAILNGETIEVAAKRDQNILETLIEAGAQPPYSCMDGACMACLGKILEGQVYQDDPGILIDDNIKACESLTCQAKPLTRIVRVTYDNL